MRRPFPPLPSQLTALLPAENLALEQLAQQPEKWPALSEEQLLSLLEHSLILGGLAPDPHRRAPLHDLYQLVVERTNEERRSTFLMRVARQVEDFQRDGTPFAEAFALVPFIEDEPPSRIVAGAIISAAVLMGGKSGDPHTGRETVLRFTRTCQEPDRQRAMIQGLLALGDDGVSTALRGCWRPMSEQNRHELCLTATQLPFPSTVEFLLTWAEDALAAGEGEREMCRPIGALSVLARVANGSKPGPYAGRGIYELIRQYPAASVPPDEVIRIGESWPVTQFGVRIEKRLRLLAAAEREEPIIAEACLAQWGRGGA